MCSVKAGAPQSGEDALKQFDQDARDSKSQLHSVHACTVCQQRSRQCMCPVSSGSLEQRVMASSPGVRLVVCWDSCRLTPCRHDISTAEHRST